MLGVLKAQFLAHLADAEFLIGEQLFGGAQQPVVDEVAGSASGLGLDQFAEVFGRVAALVGEVCHRGQSLPSCLVGYIAVQQVSKLLHHGMVDFLAGDKLAVVEAQTVVEQQFDVAHYQFARVLVDATLQFLLYHREDTPVDFYFTTREMQGFVAGVVEELVAPDILAELSAVEQVGVEEQRCPLGHGHLGVGLHMDRLAGGKTGHRHFVEVVLRTAVGQPAALVLLQEERVETVVTHVLFEFHLAVKSHHRHQRMQSRHPVVVVELLNRTAPYLFHYPITLTMSSTICVSSRRLSAMSCCAS